MSGSVIVAALGDCEAEAEQLVRTRFPDAAVEWLDRAELRRRPLGVLGRLARRRYDHAVLFAPDLRQPRLRLTSVIGCLPRARRRYRADLRGRLEPLELGSHLRASGPAIARHLAACALALLLARPLLRLAEFSLGPRRPFRRPDRVLYLRSQLWLGLRGGGSVAHTAGVIRGLQQAGVAVHVVSSDQLPGVAAPTSLVPPECWFDGRLREVEELAYNVPFALAALRAARAFRPQAIYQRHAAFNISGALLARLLGVPLILEFNSSEVWKGRHWGGLHHLGLATLAERVNLRAADRVVVVSRVLRDQLLAAHLPPARLVLNPNAVDARQFRPDVDAGWVRARHPALAAPRAVVVGFAGTFGVWHGIPTLAAALPLVLAARPGVRFLLVGDGPRRRLVDAAVARHGLAGRVVCPGLIPHQQMPAYLAACDVLISPHARQADGGEFFGSPTKLYEYMAAGRAIVASQVGQIGEVLRHGETGLLVPPEDPAALAEAILRLVDDAALRDRLGAAARARAEREHTWRENAERALGNAYRVPGAG